MGDGLTTLMAMAPFGNAVTASANNKANWNLTTKVQKEQNAWQAEQNQIDREWQAEQWLNQFKMQSDEYYKQLFAQQEQWQKQFDITNQYNSPKELVSRLIQAGINPSAALQSLSGMAGLSSASPSSNSPNVASPGTMGSHSVTPSSFNAGGWEKPSATFSSIAQLGDTIAKLQSVGLDTERQNALLKAEVEKTMAEADAMREQALLTHVNRSIQEVFGKDKIGAEISSLVSQSYAFKAKGDLDKANELYSSALERLTSLQAEGYNQQLPYLISNLEQLGKLYKSQQKANYASAVASSAIAKYHGSLTQTENALRDGRVRAQDLSNEINGYVSSITRNDLKFSNETQVQRLQLFTNELEKQQLINREFSEKIKKAITDNDWQSVEKMMNVVSSTIGNVVSLRSVGAQELNAINGQTRNEIQNRIAESLERGYWTEENVYRNSDGGFTRQTYHSGRSY